MPRAGVRLVAHCTDIPTIFSHSWVIKSRDAESSPEKVLVSAALMPGPVIRAVKAGAFTLRMFTADANFVKGYEGGYWLIVCPLDGWGSPWPLIQMWSEDPESGPSWIYCLALVVKHCQSLLLPGVVVISDENPGLALAVKQVLPNAHHALDVFHFAEKTRKSFGKKVVNLYYKWVYLPDTLDRGTQDEEVLLKNTSPARSVMLDIQD